MNFSIESSLWVSVQLSKWQNKKSRHDKSMDRNLADAVVVDQSNERENVIDVLQMRYK